MGTQTGWQPDWGWGELDLNTALAQRLNFAADTVPANGVRFYRATTQAAGDRATLVWDRRVSLCHSTGCGYQPNSGWQVFTLSNLALTELDANTGAVQAQSNSTLDNVQQVRSPAAGSVIYKVTSGQVDGLSGEPFALAAKNPLTPLVTPQPATTVQLSNTSWLHPGVPVTVTAQVANPSPDLTAGSVQATLALPAGVSLVSGSPTVSLGTLGTKGSGSDTATVSWIVEGTSDGLKQLSVTTSGTAYGSTLSSTASGSFGVDSTAPTVSIATPGGSTTNPAMPIAWGATDAGSGVASYDIDVSVDGGPLSPWMSATGGTAATYIGEAGHTYVFAVRATDHLGNESSWLSSAPLVVSEPPVSGGGGGGGKGTQPTSATGVSLANPGLRVSGVKRSSATITIAGEVARAAHAAVLVTWTARVGKKVYRVVRRARPRHGHFKLTLAIPADARSAKSATLVFSYPRSGRYAAETRRLRLRSS